MLLRRVVEHFRKQEWTAIAIDFAIVVLGVFIGLQVQAWSVERARRENEQAYLTRLHSEVENLIRIRKRYDDSRATFSADLLAAVRVLEQTGSDAVISIAQCDAIAGSAHTTVPPADLPTITELVSAGRIDQFSSAHVRSAILMFTQEAARARDLILVISDSGRDLGKAYPALITHHVGDSRIYTDEIWLNSDCHTEAMRADPAFLNELGENAYMYDVYNRRGIIPVSAMLSDLHDVLDAELGIVHAP